MHHFETLIVRKNFVEEITANLPRDWVIKRNEIILPWRDYFDIIKNDRGLFPRNYFMWVGIKGGWGANQLEVHALNLEEGFSPAIPLAFRPNSASNAAEKLRWTSSDAAYPLIEGAKFRKEQARLVSDGGFYYRA